MAALHDEREDRSQTLLLLLAQFEHLDVTSVIAVLDFVNWDSNAAQQELVDMASGSTSSSRPMLQWVPPARPSYGTPIASGIGFSKAFSGLCNSSTSGTEWLKGFAAALQRRTSPQDVTGMREPMANHPQVARMLPPTEEQALADLERVSSGLESYPTQMPDSVPHAEFGPQAFASDADLEEAIRRSIDDEYQYGGGFAVPPVDSGTVQRSSVESIYCGAGSEGDELCSICLTDFEIGDCLRTLQCMHRFHASCVDMWLAMSGKCAVCQTLVDEARAP